MLDLGAPPLAKVTNVGCPWHGAALNGGLYSSVGGSLLRAWPQTDDSETQLIRVPGLPEPTRTQEQQAADDANGYSWKNFALAAGATLHGKALPENWVIYIDGNGQAWLLEINSRWISGSTWGVTVTLLGIFGRFSLTPYPAVNRELADFQDTNYAWGNSSAHVGNGAVGLERNSTGSEVFCHAYQTSGGAFHLDSKTTEGNLQLRAVYQVQISGNGSTDRATLGDGITATATLYRDINQCYSSSQSVSGQARWSNGPYHHQWSDQSSQTSCPDCNDFVEYQYHSFQLLPENDGLTDITRTTHAQILRVLFDENDAVVEYSGDYYEESYTQQLATLTAYTCTATTTTTYSPILDGTGQCTGCLQTGFSTVYDYGTHYSDRIQRATSTYGAVLKRDGVIIDEIEVSVHDDDVLNYHIDCPTSSLNNAWAVWIFDGDSQERWVEVDGVRQNEIEAGNVFFHPYSFQVIGLQARGVLVGANPPDPGWCQLGAVVAPWGSDATHEDVIRNDASGLAFRGSHHPIDHDLEWYIPGVTDFQGAQINFI